LNFSQEKISELEARVSKAPGNIAFARLADHYRSQGHVDNAITLCEKGVKQNPDYPTGHLLLGRCYYEKERVEEAIAEFMAVLELDRKNVFALKIMGDICAQKGQNTQAAQYYKRASDYDPLNSALQDICRRFERYYRDPAQGSKDAPSAPVSRTPEPQETLEEVTVSEAPRSGPRSSKDTSAVSESAAEPPVARALDSITPSESLDNLMSFDDLQSAPPSSDQKVADAPRASKGGKTAPKEDLVSLEQELGLDPLGAAELPKEITEEEAIKVGEQAQTLSGTAAEPSAAPNESPRGTGVETEMVDLPPEMTGGSREERVGDFKARKSIMDRLAEEQDALLETVASKPAEAPSAPAPAPVEMADPVPKKETVPLPEVSSFAPGADGYYTVSGEASSAEATPEAALSGIDNVEMPEALDVAALEGVPVAQQSQEQIEQLLEPAAEGEAGPAVLPTEIKASAVAALSAETTPPDEPQEPEDDLQSLLQEIEVDDSLKGFVAGAAQDKPAPTPTPASAPVEEKASAPAPQKPPEIVKEIPAEPLAVSEESISIAAPGMQGFYSVSGEAASSESGEALEDIDHVEMAEVLEDDALPVAEVPDAPEASPAAILPQTQEAPGAEVLAGAPEVELGEDIEIIFPEVPGASSPPDPEIPIPAETAPAAASQESGPAPEAAGKKESRKKGDKRKTKVVSNVATSSLAEIYLRQGHKEQALAVFKKILEQNPDNKRVQAKIEKIEKELESAE
jgi:tetratricopeptide (TPR) repeat protein